MELRKTCIKKFLIGNMFRYFISTRKKHTITPPVDHACTIFSIYIPCRTVNFSINCGITLWFIAGGILKWLKTISIYVPWQDSPFPEKPMLQLQPNEPIVFSHVALPWQLSVPSSHSLISVRFYTNRNYTVNNWKKILSHIIKYFRFFAKLSATASCLVDRKHVLGHFSKILLYIINQPWQYVPFPVKPVLQEQENEPSVFVQLAPPSQLLPPSEHSSISENGCIYWHVQFMRTSFVYPKCLLQNIFWLHLQQSFRRVFVIIEYLTTNCFSINFQGYFKGLLTEREVCIVKYQTEVF
jgi:hypothetical protein